MSGDTAGKRYLLTGPVGPIRRSNSRAHCHPRILATPGRTRPGRLSLTSLAPFRKRPAARCSMRKSAPPDWARTRCWPIETAAPRRSRARSRRCANGAYEGQGRAPRDMGRDHRLAADNFHGRTIAIRRLQHRIRRRATGLRPRFLSFSSRQASKTIPFGDAEALGGGDPRPKTRSASLGRAESRARPASSFPARLAICGRVAGEILHAPTAVTLNPRRESRPGLGRHRQAAWPSSMRGIEADVHA